MSSYIVFLSNSPVGFTIGLQGLTAQSTVGAELVAAEIAMNGLGFGTRFRTVSVYIDHISALHVAGSRTYTSRVNHVALP